MQSPAKFSQRTPLREDRPKLSLKLIFSHTANEFLSFCLILTSDTPLAGLVWCSQTFIKVMGQTTSLCWKRVEYSFSKPKKTQTICQVSCVGCWRKSRDYLLLGKSPTRKRRKRSDQNGLGTVNMSIEWKIKRNYLIERSYQCTSEGQLQ